MILPEGIVSTGWPAVRDTCANLGVKFDDWQDGAGRAILSKDADGLYATSTGGVVMSIPRQVGKTFLIGMIIFALCIITPGLTVIWTAHRFRTADETFESMRSTSKMKSVAGHIEKVTAGAGDQAIYFVNGSRILFGARESGFGRGFSKVDVLVFDEAQILTERAIDDMIPAQNASANALTLMIGTPPKPTDPSEVFQNRRRDALEGAATDMVYIEFSADRGSDPDDRKQWRKANPSYPGRTGEAAMIRMRRNLSEESFIREAMGIWDEMWNGNLAFTKWDERAIANPDPEWPVAAYGVDMNLERTKVSIGVATFAEGDDIHLELAADTPFDERGTSALVEWLWERCKRRVPIVIDGYSPARDVLEARLKARKMMVRILQASEYTQACEGLHEAVERHPSVSHFGQEHLDASAKATTQEPIKNRPGSFKWNRTSLDVDLAPTVAVTCAHYGARKFARRVPKASAKKPRGPIVF